MEVRCHMGSVVFDDGFVTIRHSFGARPQGVKEATIPVSSIVSIEVCDATLMRKGVLSFRVMREDGGVPPAPEKLADCANDYYSIFYTRKSTEEIRELTDAIQSSMPKSPSPLPDEYAVRITGIHKAMQAERENPRLAALSGDDGTVITLREKTISNSLEERPLAGVSARLESGSDLQSRVSMTRLLALGVFAFAAKKESGGEKYVTVEGPDFMWMAEVNRKRIKEAMRFVSMVNDAARKAPIPASSSPSIASVPAMDTAAELERLASLHSSGALSDEEFAAAKRKALGL